MQEIQKEQGVEVPRRNAHRIKYGFHRLEVGESMVLTGNPRNIREGAGQYGRRHNKKFTCRTMTADKVRVWREE